RSPADVSRPSASTRARCPGSSAAIAQNPRSAIRRETRTCSYSVPTEEQWPLVDGGTSRAGFWSKKPNGWRVKPTYSTGITGQSSGRGTWLTPKEYQTTTSVFSRGRSPAVNDGRPSPPGDRLGYPAARASSAENGVPQ